MNDILLSRINSIKISIDDSVLVALKKMDATYRRLLLVYDNEQFINIVSIGDIQRAIIQNRPLDIPVGDILRKDTRLATKDDSFDEIKKQMINHRSECMPVVDRDHQLIEIYFWEDLFPPQEKRIPEQLNLPVVIMAGGRGTRLKPLTNILPKPLIPLGKKTILESIMDRFINVGCNEFHLSVNYKSEMIKQYFIALQNPAYHISYVQEKEPLGTAGSLFLLKGKITQTFFISNCDIIIEDNYWEIYNYHKENHNELTIIAALKHYPIPYGTINSVQEGLLEELNEKPELTLKINSGMYIMEPHLLNEVPKNKFFNMTDLIEKTKSRGGRVGVFPVSEKAWMDIGEWDEYLKQL